MALLENLTFLDASSSSGFLLLGFLIGMVHALEADHLAAVSTLSNGGKNKLLLRGRGLGLGPHGDVAGHVHRRDSLQPCPQ